MTQFQITRLDGRSNGQVIIDYVKDDKPGTEYTYARLASELSKGTDRTYDREAVRSIVMATYPRLLKEHQRALHNIRGVGYRLAFAHQHQTLALVRKRRADKQLKLGLMTLQKVRWDEMDQQQVLAHEGTLLVVGALYNAQAALSRRQDKVEETLAAHMKGKGS